MNFLTLEYDCNMPVTQQINVPTNSDYKVGIKVKKDGEIQTVPSSTVKLIHGDTTLSADAEKTNGYVTFTRSANDNASCKEYTVDVDTTDYTTIHGGTKRTSSSLLMDNFYLSSYPELSGQSIYGQNIRVLYSDAEDGDYKEINYTKMDPAFFVDFRDPV